MHVLPEHRDPERLEAEIGKAIEIVQMRHVTRSRDLVEVPIANAIHRTLDAAPHLEPRQAMQWHVSRPSARGYPASGAVVE